VRLAGQELVGRPPRAVLDAGVGYVPEDREHDGVIGTFSVAENLVLDQHDRAPYGSRVALRPASVRREAQRLVEEFDVRTQSVHTPVGTLSGGNKQKVVLARELSRPLQLFIAAQPTRGLDVGSIEFVHRRVVHERDVGTAVVLVSTELDEVLALADRIAVMYRGRLVGVVGPQTPRDALGLMMAGVPEEEALRTAAQAPTALGDSAAGGAAGGGTGGGTGRAGGAL
jgi:simple sugar transport system ATP-binding protein